WGGWAAVDCRGVCRPVGERECTDDAQCPVLDAMCTVCPDGTASCAQSRCVNGACSIDVKPCAAPQTCGGGVSCEPGFECVDDPSDECAPERGDADCGGICVPQASPRGCGGTAGATCPPGFQCVAALKDMCVPQNGADCPGICQPVKGGECTSDEDCPVLPVPCSFCADGTLACPRRFCDGGRCALAFSACPPPPGCASDADCVVGQVC